VDLLLKCPSWAEFFRRSTTGARLLFERLVGLQQYSFLFQPAHLPFLAIHYSGRKEVPRYWIESVVANKVAYFMVKVLFQI